jgi:hypothetical protein
MTSTDLALTRPEPMMDQQALATMLEQAERYVASGLLPASIKTAQQALIIMAQGRELGIPATVALRGIVVVNGKPTCSAELMMALVRRAYGQGAMRVAKTDSKSCTVQYRQSGWDGISENSFTIEEAEQAGLFKNPVWKQYPAAMLRARAISATVRFAFPECISGLYTPEELGASVKVVDGEVVPAEPPALSAPDRCDAEHWNKAWHVAVKGTRFADDETRHKFIAWFTGGRFDSLTTYLESATRGQAEDLIGSIEQRIAAEAKKSQSTRPLADVTPERADLNLQLRAAVQEASDLGGDFEVPANLDELTDDAVREMLGTVVGAIESVRPSGVPA